LVLIQLDVVDDLKFSRTTANARQRKTYALLQTVHVLVDNNTHGSDSIGSLEPFGEVVNNGFGGREESVTSFFFEHESASIVHSDFDFRVVKLFDFFLDGLFFVA
jgi:hypothetical protein